MVREPKSSNKGYGNTVFGYTIQMYRLSKAFLNRKKRVEYTLSEILRVEARGVLNEDIVRLYRNI